jgi:Xaa-Pro aminopeptidase
MQPIPPGSLLGLPDFSPARFDPHLHAARRQRLLEQLGNGAVVVLAAAAEAERNGGTAYPFRQNSDFFYFTGFPEPDALLVLAEGKSILFCRPKDPEKETWTGYRTGPQEAKAHYGFDAAYSIDELPLRFLPLLGKRPRAFSHRALPAALRAPLKRHARFLRSAEAAIAAMRLVKDEAEWALMQRAADISAAGHLAAMAKCRPGMMEYELEAEISHTFRKAGAAALHAYPPIVAAGINACTLHYDTNQSRINDGGLILVDAGCEFANYAGDITRTFPANGKFSAAQRDCYDIVLAAHDAAIAGLAPGKTAQDAHMAAVRVLAQGMADLGLLQGEVDGIIEQGAYKRFYMHGTGHWLGLDVHDVGDRKAPLRPDMAITVEPGLYIRPGQDVPESLAGIGIRIEDDVRITAEGCKVYTKLIRTANEIESWMRQNA